MTLRGWAIIISCFHSLFISCSTGMRERTEYASGTKEGYDLAKYHCGNCHAFVPANTLDKQLWESRVLPAMAPMLGIEVLWGNHYVNEGGNGAQLSYKDWMKIVEYYTKTAPDSTTLSEKKHDVATVDHFETVEATTRISNPSKTVLTVFDTAGQHIYTSDDGTDQLYKWNTSNQVIDSIKTYSPVVDVSFFVQENKRKGVITMIGSLRPSDAAIGKILVFDPDKPFRQRMDTITMELPRPVQTSAADFNNDGLVDLLNCGFGRMRGGLFLFLQESGGQYSRQTVSELPGATQAHIGDFNKDGHADIIALFAHSEESIRMFINDGAGNFSENVLLSFPPVYGSSSLDLADFNNDGLQDILYTCGDNNDLSSVFKPFHGVYIYLNKGENKFEQAYFQHINGSTKAIARDLDNDGDLDIATIAFYGNFRENKKEAFLILRQDGPLRFTITSPAVERSGRWLTMDINDFDNDGDNDIILGNFADNFFINKNFKPDWNMRAPFTILKNGISAK